MGEGNPPPAPRGTLPQVLEPSTDFDRTPSTVVHLDPTFSAIRLYNTRITSSDTRTQAREGGCPSAGAQRHAAQVNNSTGRTLSLIHI